MPSRLSLSRAGSVPERCHTETASTAFRPSENRRSTIEPGGTAAANESSTSAIILHELKRIEAGMREQGAAHRRELRRVEERLGQQLAIVLELLSSGAAAGVALGAAGVVVDGAMGGGPIETRDRSTSRGQSKAGGLAHLGLGFAKDFEPPRRYSRGSKGWREGTYVDQVRRATPRATPRAATQTPRGPFAPLVAPI
eukprot:2466080-Prymnesium_polylepis.1